jgi:hypothetical protein
MRNSAGSPRAAYNDSQWSILAASGSDEPKCALTLRARFALPGETRSSQPS